MAKNIVQSATVLTKKKMWTKVGVWSYVIGLVIAVVVGILAQFGAGGLGAVSVGVLAVLGVIVGLLNIGDEEVNTFLLAAIAFVVASSGMATIFAVLGSAFSGLTTFMGAIAVFTAPGALVVAFKALYKVAKDD
jgi:hypothetical protein